MTKTLKKLLDLNGYLTPNDYRLSELDLNNKITKILENSDKSK